MATLFQEVYPRTVLFDYVIFGIRRVCVPKKIGKQKILIFDRYIYDVILSLSQEFGFSEEKKYLSRRYTKVFPIPDKILFIQVPPETSFLRKKRRNEVIRTRKGTAGEPSGTAQIGGRLTS